MKSLRYFLNILFLLCLPTLLHAHVGMGLTNNFAHGFIHPITGLDHFCAMVAVGIWAAQLGGRALWVVPTTFIFIMGMGSWLGISHVPIPFIEQGILASIFVLGLLITTATRLPLIASMIIVGLFALFHGHAHGSEMPYSASGILYGLGFVLTTALLHFSGIALAFLFQRFASVQLIRIAGLIIMSFGLYIYFQS